MLKLRAISYSNSKIGRIMKEIKPTAVIFLAAVIIIFASAALLLMGRVPFCECGYVKLWHGVTASSENSQHIADPYTFTHLIHGIVLYAILRLFFRRAPAGLLIVGAVFLESAWEIFENTDFVINRYREATISLDYYGDSVINSAGDIATAAAGAFLAARFPLWAAIAAVVIVEAALLYFIRDSLVLNILMLVYPVEAVKIWQMGV